MKILLDETEYEVKGLTIEQYLALRDDKDISEVQLISMMTGAPEQLIVQAPMTQVKFVASMLTSELSGINDTGPLVLDLDFRGTKYGLIKPSKMSYEEWINMEVFMSQSPVNLLKIATHLYRPLASDKYGEDRELVKYNLTECESREDEFRQFPIKVILSALFFLTTFAKILTDDTLSSTHNLMNKIDPLKLKKLLDKMKLSKAS